MNADDPGPLASRRVLVTRSRDQALGLIRKLESVGAVALVAPAIEILPPADWALVDEALGRLADYDWLVFTSANGVRGLCGRMKEAGRDFSELGRVKIAAIGPATAVALLEFQLDANLVPSRYRSEDLAEALAECAAGKRILLARADRARDVLPKQLAAIARVDEVIVYRQVDTNLTDDELQEAIRCGEVDYVTLTSSNIARSFVRSLDAVGQERIRSGHLRLVSISPVTSQAIIEMGFPVAAEAREHTTNGLIAAILELARLPN